MSDSKPADQTKSSLGSAPIPYKVLARKYRPTEFSRLIGQEVLVRTLTNAFKTGRLAHAFILTGVRGVGKTTAARIIARSLNCVGPDGGGTPTIEPCNECEHCTAISEDRHIDVLEIDAASRTGVDDIRELIDGVPYRPTSARYKVYIIDEIHMLSKNAFNALLKTLEEPPEHVKFIFATTEIRKVPVTVLSRCQRFDLRRVDIQSLEKHFSAIADTEGAEISATAMHLIARAADGSVRDGLSLLDQAISHAGGAVSESQVRNMLGLADRSQSFVLLEALMAGDVAGGLKIFERMFVEGADPSAVLEDLLEVVHWLTRVKVVPSVLNNPAVPEIERTRGEEIGDKLSMPALSRAWLMLLKGLGEVRQAPSARQATDMVLIRLAYTATLPTPEEALKLIEEDRVSDSEVTGLSSEPAVPTGGSAVPVARTATEAAISNLANSEPSLDPHPDTLPSEPPEASINAMPVPQSFEEVLALVDEKREGMLRTNLLNNIHLVVFERGRIEFRPVEGAPQGLAGQLGDFLNANTGAQWIVSISQELGQPTIAEQRSQALGALEVEAAQHPLVKQVLDTFPDAEIKAVRQVEEE